MEIIAHRGYSAIAPENTLSAFDCAWQQGADSLEFDVQLTHDGIPVIFHDATLTRLVGSPHTVAETSLSVLKQFDVGQWFSPQYRGETIPTLAEAIPIFQKIPQCLYFDIKPYCQWSDQDIQRLIEQLAENHLLHKSIFTSFNESFLEKCRQISPNIQLGYFLVKMADYPQQLTKAILAQKAIISSLYTVILENPHIISEFDNYGIELVVWTVDEPQAKAQLLQLGVKRIITNTLISNQ